MTLADTPRTWPNGPSMSTLEVILIFAGIPLLVILTIFLLVYAPSWVKGPRYRPGQPWEANPEWFGPAMKDTGGTTPEVTAGGPEGPATPVGAAQTSGAESGDTFTGGASAGW